MLNPDYLVPFLTACLLIAVSPGPSNAFLMAQTLAYGRRAGMLCAIGFALAGIIHTFFAVIGLSALLKTSPTAYAVVQYLGAAYLCYLGVVTLWQARAITPQSTEKATPMKSRNPLFQALLTETLNPKVALFFIAFIPQFVDSTLPTSTTAQLAIFGILFPLLAFPVDCAYIYFGDKIAGYFQRSPAAQLWVECITGIIFITLAVNLLW